MGFTPLTYEEERELKRAKSKLAGILFHKNPLYKRRLRNTIKLLRWKIKFFEGLHYGTEQRGQLVHFNRQI